METLNLINQLFVIFISLMCLVLGFWVFFSDRRSRANQIFLTMTLAFIGWITFAYLSDVVGERLSILWLIRFSFASIAASLLSTYLFSIYFPTRSPRTRFLKIANVVAVVWGASLFFLSLFSDLLVTDVYMESWGTGPVLGLLGGFFYGGVVVLAILLLINFIRKFFSLSHSERIKIYYFLIGLGIMVGANLVFNVILPLFQGQIKFYQLGNYSVVFLLGFTAYAMVRKNLFGIKVVLTTLLVVLMAIFLLLDMVVLTANSSVMILKGGILAAFLFFGYSLIRSVSREIKLREQLEEANVKLTKLDQAKSEFISIASHQLRTPLSAIKGYLSMVIDLDYGEGPEPIAKILTRVYNSNERLIALVNNMLNISRIESGRIQFDPRPLQIEPVITDVLAEIKPEAQSRQIQLFFPKSCSLSRKVQADERILHEVLNNLVDNAVKYTPHGRVTISLRPHSAHLEVRVQDTGIGIEAADIPRLFKKFSRGPDVYKNYTSGSGLGLYVVKQLIEMHQGKVGVESAGTGQGSTFWFTLPFT